MITYIEPLGSVRARIKIDDIEETFVVIPNTIYKLTNKKCVLYFRVPNDITPHTTINITDFIIPNTINEVKYE